MATYERFEDTPVWQAAADLAVKIFDWSRMPCSAAKAISPTRCSVRRSISNNIAEGFERGTTNELLQFIY